jgi:hypothetical protein
VQDKSQQRLISIGLVQDKSQQRLIGTVLGASSASKKLVSFTFQWMSCFRQQPVPEFEERDGGRCRPPWLSGPPSLEISLSAAAIAAKIDKLVNR